MRDRETDSWWSIMTSKGIGGEFDGSDLVALPAGEKVSWNEWHQRHPDTLVLSVDGEEHVDNNPYDNYFSSEGTFRDLKIEDDRLEPKAPIYSFWFGGEPWAVPHKAYGGGRIFKTVDLAGKSLLLYRDKKAPIYQGSRAYLIDPDLASAHDLKELLAMSETGADGIEVLAGFDTFWYTWVAVNENTHLVE